MNAAKSSECTACSAGTYCKEGSSAKVTCPINAYCEAGSVLFTDCALNYHRTTTGGTASSDCTTCDTNYMCPGGTDPISCPAGFSGSYAGNTVSGQMVCTPTTNGTYSASPNTAKSTCPNGQYSWETATSCFSCLEGHYCSSGTMNDCPVGSYCP